MNLLHGTYRSQPGANSFIPVGVPYGKVPVLEIERDDGQARTIVSAKPICRYLASKYGLTAEDSFEDSQCDEYMDSLTDYTGSKH